MGDPRKQRPKFQTPQHPWNKTRIEEEKALLKEYGLKNKTEIWKMNAIVSNITGQVKRLTTLKGRQADLERKQLVDRLNRLGLLQENAALESVLGMQVKEIMERRLQTIIFRKKLAKSVKQARQFIVHEHILIKGIKMTIPSYIVSAEEENAIEFAPKSALADEMHPERKIEEEVEVVKEVTTETKKAEEKPKTEDKKKATKKVDKKETQPKKDDKKKAEPKKEGDKK